MCETQTRVPESNIAKLEAGFEKLAKRAAKLGLVAPKLIKGELFDVQFKKRILEQDEWRECREGEKVDASSFDTCFRQFSFCSVDGVAPVIDGWELISIIDHTTDSEVGNLIRNVPGKETPVEYRKARPICHHCNSERRRNETFLLLKDGEYKQVGRNCLADFCRDPAMAAGLIHAAEYLDAASNLIGEASDDDFGGGGFQDSRYPIGHVLTITRRIIRKLGWMSRKTALEMYSGHATASYVSQVVTDPKWKQHASRELLDAMEDVSEEDEKIGVQSLEWIRSKRDDADSMNDYLYNLLVVCSQERIPSKHFGLACSLVPAFMREQQMEVERKLRQDREGNSQHFGTVNKREKFTLTVIGLNEFESDWGLTTFVKMIDAAGNVAMWKASGEVEMDLESTYIVTGTVKDHSIYRGVNQTVLSRCKCELIEPEVSDEPVDDPKLAELPY